MLETAKQNYEIMNERRSCRKFSDKLVPIEIIEEILRTASTAPSGANLQPWEFHVVEDQELKQLIRVRAEQIEKEFYKERISDEWQEKLDVLNVNWKKEFLTDAPYLICVFVKYYDVDEFGNKTKYYYPVESTGLATGFMINTIHRLGLSCLTYTPAPMGFIKDILDLGDNVRPFMVIPVGFAADDVEYPDIKRKELNDFAKFY
jgi:nitroreductase